MFKAVKKLKFWSRKKRKRKSLAPQPSHCFCHCSHSTSSHYYQCNYPYSPLQPSAPPLPPWFQAELTQDEFLTSEQAEAEPFPEFSHPTDLVQDIESDPMIPAAAVPSYQQYMVSNPVYGPVVQQTVICDPVYATSFLFWICFIFIQRNSKAAATVIATDFSPVAVAVATTNVQRYGLQ
ncbi:hypothetical protein Gotur_016150, partial [Gossypium turneri]